jgi:hypothetical protein
MLDHPKFLLFAITSFLFIHIISGISETGTLNDVSGFKLGWGLGFAGTVKGLLAFRYSWLEGDLFLLGLLLAIIQAVFVALIARDIARMIRGV